MPHEGNERLGHGAAASFATKGGESACQRPEEPPSVSGSTEVKEQLLKQIRQAVSDKSWRVRYMAATHSNEARSINPFAPLGLSLLLSLSVGRSCGTGSV